MITDSGGGEKGESQTVEIFYIKRDGIICFSYSTIAQNHRKFSFFQVDFGEVLIPPMLDVPRPRVLPEFKRLAHGLRSGNISVLDAKTFYIPNLHYDGAGPDAYFWVGNGSEPNIMGIKVPNELGSYEVLRGYQGEDIEIQLPGNLTVCEYLSSFFLKIFISFNILI